MNQFLTRSLAGVAVLFFFTCSVWAERAAPSPESTDAERCRTVATFELTLADGTEMKVVGIVGGPAIQVRNEDLALDLELQPQLHGPSGISLEVFEVERPTDGAPLRKRIDSAEIWSGSPAFVGPVFSQVRVDLSDLQRRAEETGTTSASEVELDGQDALKPRAGQCCLACGATEACGCAVSLSCGSCCVGVCCPQ